MFGDPLYDDAFFTRLELLQKPNFVIETIKSDLNIELIKSDNVNKQVYQAVLIPKHGKGCLTRVLYTYQQQSLQRLRLHVF